jgi:hypothetical protein
MPERLTLTPTQLTVLRTLNEGVVEISPIEVAVSGRLLPNQARSTLVSLEEMGLVESWPSSGLSGEQLYVSSPEGTNVYRTLEKFKGTPPVGAIFRVLPNTFSSFLSRQPSVLVEIAPEVQAANTD